MENGKWKMENDESSQIANLKSQISNLKYLK
jgi:hypothetical protein